MIQSGEILGGLHVTLSYAALKAGTQELIQRVPQLSKDATRYFVNKGINRFQKDFKLGEGSGIALTSNEIKYIIKVIKSLENRRILLKGTTTKITSQEGGFLNFLRQLMTAGLPLMKLENLLQIKLSKEISIEYKHTIQYLWIFCIRFIDFMIKSKSLLENTNIFYRI